MSDKRTLFLDSKDKENGNYSNYTIQFDVNDPFFSVRDDEELRVEPTRFSQLNDSPNVNEFNRTFVIRQVDLGTSAETDITISLTTGIYDTYSLQLALQTAITDGLNAGIVDSSFSTSIVLDEDTGKYEYSIFATTSHFDSYEFLFVFDSVDTTLATLMGFSDGEYLASSSSGSTVIFNSYQAANMVFQAEVNVHCSLVGRNYESSTTGMRSSDILFAINQGAKNDFMVFENDGNNLYRTYCVPQFSSIQIRLLDYLDREIPFQSNSRLALTFTKIKKDTQTSKMIEILEKISDLNQMSLLRDYLDKKL